MKGENMLVKTHTYTDFDGNERTEDFLFNYTEAQIAELEWSKDGGLSSLLAKITKEKDNRQLLEYWKKFVLGAYGIKSPDGKKFLKSKEISDDFEASAAFSDIFMELCTDTQVMSDFVNAVVPRSVRASEEKADKPAVVIDIPKS